MFKRLTILSFLILIAGGIYSQFVGKELNPFVEKTLQIPTLPGMTHWGEEKVCKKEVSPVEGKKEDIPMKILKYLCILVLSLVFILSGLGKILSPKDFMENLLRYQMFPLWMIKAAVILLPWAEVLCGLGLLIPLFRRPAALLILLMNVMFIVILAIALSKGVHASCGCFGTLSEEISLQAISRDLVFLSMALFIYLN